MDTSLWIWVAFIKNLEQKALRSKCQVFRYFGYDAAPATAHLIIITRDKIEMFHLLFHGPYIQQNLKFEVTWPFSHVVTWSHKTNSNISFPQNVRPPNFQGLRFRVRGFQLLSHTTTWLQDHLPNDQNCVKNLYFCSTRLRRYQNWLDGDLQWNVIHQIILSTP